jgi:hypothetical protein
MSPQGREAPITLRDGSTRSRLPDLLTHQRPLMSLGSTTACGDLIRVRKPYGDGGAQQRDQQHDDRRPAQPPAWRSVAPKEMPPCRPIQTSVHCCAPPSVALRHYRRGGAWRSGSAPAPVRWAQRPDASVGSRSRHATSCHSASPMCSASPSSSLGQRRITSVANSATQCSCAASMCLPYAASEMPCAQRLFSSLLRGGIIRRHPTPKR